MDEDRDIGDGDDGGGGGKEQNAENPIERDDGPGKSGKTQQEPRRRPRAVDMFADSDASDGEK